MKLIIDIDEKDYAVLKNISVTPDWDVLWHGKEKDKELTFATFNLVKALVDGIPYEEKLTGKYKTACNVLLDLEQITRHSVGWEDNAIEAVHNAVQTAIEALKFAESQTLCCDNCVNRTRKSKEVCTSPYGMCEFFKEENQEGGREE